MTPFNFSIDIIYFDELFDQRRLDDDDNPVLWPPDQRMFRFFDSLSPRELSGLQSIALANGVGDTKSENYRYNVEC